MEVGVWDDLCHGVLLMKDRKVAIWLPAVGLQLSLKTEVNLDGFWGISQCSSIGILIPIATMVRGEMFWAD